MPVWGQVGQQQAAFTLAANLADVSSQTLIGILRDTNMTIYTHPERIAGAA